MGEKQNILEDTETVHTQNKFIEMRPFTRKQNINSIVAQQYLEVSVCVAHIFHKALANFFQLFGLSLDIQQRWGKSVL